MLDLTEYTYCDVLGQNDNVIVYCWADWCSPCKMFAPIFKEVENESAGIVFTKVNVDEQAHLTMKLNVRSIPTILFYKKGQLRDTIIGATSKDDLLKRIKSIYV
ncbi:MAG: thioredoxin [Ignavibacteriaceae bacterium]|jgi:thioredoxin 1|nr:MAG: thioredoxin [Ignavibacteriaceae bacterium]